MKRVILMLLAGGMIVVCGCESGTDKPGISTKSTELYTVESAKKPLDFDVLSNEISLFDGETMGNWKVTEFIGTGKVYVKDGAIHMERGNDMSGITWGGSFVRMNYEISLEAMRVDGEDFFCGLTFPVDKDCCTFVCGGWGGTICGLSTIDYYDAANNSTFTSKEFKKNQWYKIRVCVTPNGIKCWIDDELLVKQVTTGHKIGVRFEVESSRPLGVATWQTGGAVRNITLRKLADVEVDKIEEEMKKEDEYF